MRAYCRAKTVNNQLLNEIFLKISIKSTPLNRVIGLLSYGTDDPGDAGRFHNDIAYIILENFIKFCGYPMTFDLSK